jgi:hypothetical protein
VSMRKLLRRQGVQTLAPLLLYSGFAAIWMGRGMLAHPGTRVLGDPYKDKAILMWSFRWWPHAIAHGHDPFAANVVWAPHGIDLAWVTSSPTLALALTPVTTTAGPVVAYNIAALASAPLAAWTTSLLARRLTRSFAASLVAGFLFGFSPYVVAQSVGHLNLSFVCFVPLAGFLAVRFFQGDLGRWWFTGLLTLVLALQFGVSTEVFATLTLLGLICFLLAFLLLRSRARMGELARYTAVAYLLLALIVSPYLVHALGHTAPVRPHAATHALDLANPVFPTQVTWLRPPLSNRVHLTGQTVNRYESNVDEVGGYLGLPLLIILVLALVTLRGVARRGALVLIFAALVADALALGHEMHIAGHAFGPGPWWLVDKLPTINEAIPIRLAMYAVLFVALVVALWLAQPGRRGWRYALAGLAVVSFIPTPSGVFWTSHVRQSRFFNTSAYRTVIRPGDRALVFPYSRRDTSSMLWQAETGFRFSMIGGHIGQVIIPAECRWRDEWASIAGGAPPGGAAAFRRFLLDHRVTVVVEGPHTRPWAKALIASSIPDARSERVADATVLRIPPGLPRALPRDAPPLPKGGKLHRRPYTAVCGPDPRPRASTGSRGARRPRPHG